MGFATATQGCSVQPQWPAQVNRANPITDRLVLATPDCTFDSVRGRLFTVTGTKVVGTSMGLFRGFGSTLGAGTTDKVTTALTSAGNTRTYLAWMVYNGAGGGSLGRLIDKNATAASEMILFNGINMEFQRAASVTAMAVQMSAAPTTSAVACVCAVCFPMGTVAKVYNNGIDKSSTVAAGSGSFTNTTDALAIGNRPSDNLRNWDGLIGPVMIWDRVLSENEVKSMYANPWQVFAAAR